MVFPKRSQRSQENKKISTRIRASLLSCPCLPLPFLRSLSNLILRLPPIWGKDRWEH